MPQVSYREASRVQVLEAPLLLPGTCAICGASSTGDRKYIDIGWTIEFIGVVYFCTFCFSEAANVLGCLTKEQTEKLEDENNKLRQRILDFQAKEAALDDAINRLRESNILDYVSDRSTTSDPGVASTSNQSLNDYYAGIAERDKSNLAKPNTEPITSTSKQGPDDVSEFTINDI